MISGILIGYNFDVNKYNCQDFIKKKFKQLMVPYYIYGAIDCVIYAIVSPSLFIDYKGFISEILYYLLGMRNVDKYYFTGALWFLTTMFLSQILFNYLIQYPAYVNIIMTIIFVMIAYIQNGLRYSLPLNADLLPYAYPFLCSGYFAKKYRVGEKVGKHPFIFTTMSIVFVFMLSNRNFVDIFAREFGKKGITVFFVCGLVGSIGLVGVSKIIERYFLQEIKHIFIYIGRNSLTIMAVHQQWIIHPLNALGVMFDKEIVNFLFKYWSSLIGSIIVCKTLLKLKKHVNAP